MGRTYLFECSRCGYRAKVAGRPERGSVCFVQTIVCKDCKELYDAVVRLKAAEFGEVDARKREFGLRAKLAKPLRRAEAPPAFQSALNHLALPGAKRYKWMEFDLSCPKSARHRVAVWKETDPCPRCGVCLEKHPLPFRIWD